MAVPIARIGDLWLGVCCCCEPTCIPMGGYIITGSIGHRSSGSQVSRLNDITVGYCGHVGTIVTSSLRNKTDGIGKAIVGSEVTGCNIGTIITGDPNHITE